MRASASNNAAHACSAIKRAVKPSGPADEDAGAQGAADTIKAALERIKASQTGLAATNNLITKQSDDHALRGADRCTADARSAAGLVHLAAA